MGCEGAAHGGVTGRGYVRQRLNMYEELDGVRADKHLLAYEFDPRRTSVSEFKV